MMHRRPIGAAARFSVYAAQLICFALIGISRPALPCSCLVAISEHVQPEAGAIDIQTNAAIVVGFGLLIKARNESTDDAGLILTDDDGVAVATAEERLQIAEPASVFRAVEVLRPLTHYTASIGARVVTDFTTGSWSDTEKPLSPILIHYSVSPGSIYDCAGIPLSTPSSGVFEVAGDGPFFLLHDLGQGLDPKNDVKFTWWSDSPFIEVVGTTCNGLPSTVFHSTNLSFSTMDAALNESERTEPILVRGAMPLLCECITAESHSGLFGALLLALFVAFRAFRAAQPPVTVWKQG